MNCENELLKPWVDVALAAEKARANSFKLTINMDMAAFIVRRWASPERSGTVFFCVDENRRILSYFVQTAILPYRGQDHVHIIDEKNWMKPIQVRMVFDASELV